MTTGPARGGRPPLRPRAAVASSRLEVLHLLRTEGATTVQALAARTGLHGNTLRGHLDHLVADGLASREPEQRAVRGRPRTVYRAATDAGPDGPGTGLDPGPARGLDEAAARAGLTRLLLAAYGTPADDVAAAAVAAGERMLDVLPGPVARAASAAQAAAQAQRSALHAHLDRLGFDPEPDADGATVRLWRCPFLDLARARPEVVCAVHLGLARGVLDRVGGPVRADRLVPFAGPRRCDLHLVEAS
ncbi:helix-turn-helix transcriptional regulator [Cellulomonas sp. NPDC058312]|uniref:helix-turn-helix transcriptional regulator n=1 Tax=Cellulomonas sp. NPDC058312 TaxID=3346441 RepID=UPI0036E8B896